MYLQKKNFTLNSSISIIILVYCLDKSLPNENSTFRNFEKTNLSLQKHTQYSFLFLYY